MVHGSVGETAMVREETVGSACDVRPCRPVSGEGRGAVSRTEHGGAAGGTPGPTRPLREVRPCGDARGAWASLSTWARASGSQTRTGQAAGFACEASHFHRAVNSAGLCLAGKGLRAQQRFHCRRL